MVILDRSSAAVPVIPISWYMALFETRNPCTSVLLRWMASEKLSAHSCTPESAENIAPNFAPVCSEAIPASLMADPSCFAASIPAFTISMAAEIAKNDFTAPPTASLILVPADSPSFPMCFKSSPVSSDLSPVSLIFFPAFSRASTSLFLIVWIGFLRAVSSSSNPSLALLANCSACFPANPYAPWNPAFTAFPRELVSFKAFAAERAAAEPNPSASAPILR